MSRRRRRCWDKAAAMFQLVISKNEIRTVRQVCSLRWDSCCLSCCSIIICSTQRSNCTSRLLIMFISLEITNTFYLGLFVLGWLIGRLIGQLIGCWSRPGLDPFTFCAAPDKGMDPDFHILFNVLAEVCTLLRAGLVYLSDYSANQMTTNQTAYKISKA